MKKELFGKMPDGTSIELHTLVAAGIEAQVMRYGAGIVSIRVPDRAGRLENVVLSLPSVEAYVENNLTPGPIFLGSTVGRYANRIARARFTLEGREYTLPRNNGEHSLHGGPGGFHHVAWEEEVIENGVQFRYISKDGEQGYPGTLQTIVRYEVEAGELRMKYSATSDKTTILNLTNHAYFNLTGTARNSVLGHQLRLFASRYTPVDASLIPTGELRSVKSTPLDFREPAVVGDRIESQDEQMLRAHGYDHNHVLDDESPNLKQAAELYEPASGRVMEVWTTEPGIQFYSGNFLNGSVRGTDGVPFTRHSGLCLETQHFPDSIHQPGFPTTVLKAGQQFHSVTVLKFKVR